MTDPYSVLGISRGASMDEVKKAYRQMSRKYHPDANINNPNKAQAEEKFKQVQQAYQQIVYEKEHGDGSYDRDKGTGAGYGRNAGYGGYGQSSGYGNSYGYGQSSGSSGYSQGGSYGQDSGYGYGSPFDDLFGAYGYRQRQAPNRFSDAELQAAYNYIQSGHVNEAMNVLNQNPKRTADWYYLHAICNSALGNNVNAKADAAKAVELDPNNDSYRELQSRLEHGEAWYTRQQGGYGMNCGTGTSSLCPLCLCCMMCSCCSRSMFCCI